MCLRISIDGACRRNGKPDCVAAGGVFIQQYAQGAKLTKVLSNYEYKSTNQRGEMLALLTALDYIKQSGLNAIIITDSEYLFNAMTKDWCNRWQNNNWKTATGEPVKNADIWQEIIHIASAISTEVAYYHIKGHCISFGKVTASNYLKQDQSGLSLLRAVYAKYDMATPITISAAQELSIKNNGFKLEENILRDFVASNIVADAIATYVVEAADSR